MIVLVLILIFVVSDSHLVRPPAVKEIQFRGSNIAGAGDEGIRRVWEGGTP